MKLLSSPLLSSPLLSSPHYNFSICLPIHPLPRHLLTPHCPPHVFSSPTLFIDLALSLPHLFVSLKFSFSLAFSSLISVSSPWSFFVCLPPSLTCQWFLSIYLYIHLSPPSIVSLPLPFSCLSCLNPCLSPSSLSCFPLPSHSYLTHILGWHHQVAHSSKYHHSAQELVAPWVNQLSTDVQ